MPPLDAFLAHAVLESGEGQAGEWEDSVQMMTLHSAKGLEFPIVFLSAWRTACSRTSAPSPTSAASRRSGGSHTSASRARCGGCTSPTPSSGACTAWTSTACRRASSRSCPPELVEEVRPRVQVSRPLFGGQASGCGA
jgi:DNA helicase II / ATP-dependent DNA helicase PcrA